MTFLFTDITGRRYLRWADIACGICVVLVIVMAIIRPFYAALGFGDESYQALCVRHWNTSPLAMYTFWKGYVWTSIFTDNYVYLRFLSLITTFGAILLSCTYYAWRAHSVRKGLWVFVMCGFLATFEGHIMYNWDVGPSLLYSLGTIFSIEYYRRPRLWITSLFGATVALLAMSRIQLSVLFPLGILFVTVIGIKKQYKKRTAFFTVGFVLSAILMFIVTSMIMVGTPMNYFRAFSPANIITGHSLSDIHRIIVLVVYEFKYLIIHTCPTFLAVITGVWVFIAKNPNKWLYLSIVTLFIAIAQAIILCDPGSLDIGLNSAGLPLALFALFLLPFYNAVTSHGHGNLTMLILILLFWILIPAFGSDVFIMRLNVALVMPLCLIIGLHLNSRLQRLLSAVCIISTISFGGTAIAKTIIEMNQMSRGLSEFPKHEGLHAQPRNYYEFKTIYDLHRSVQEAADGARVNFDGSRYEYTYSLQDAPVAYLHKFHSRDSLQEIADIHAAADNYDVWFFCHSTRSEINIVKRALTDEGYVPVYDDLHTQKATIEESEARGNVIYMRQPHANKWLEINKSKMP